MNNKSPINKNSQVRIFLKIRKMLMCVGDDRVSKVTVAIESEVANYLSNRKRRELAAMEDEHDVEVVVVSREDASPEFLKLECEDSNGREVRISDL